MSLRRVIIRLLIVGGIFAVGTANGALLATDSSAMSGFHGSQPFSATVGALSFAANVEYAVYAPGTFHNSTALGGPTDPSGGTQFVYAYQMSNVGTGLQRTVGELSVGLDGVQTPTNLGVISGGGSPFGFNPSSFTFVPASPPFASATWTYSPELTEEETGNVLLFTSPNPPHFYNASVLGGALANQQQLPSPIPEPSTVLIVVGLSLAGMTKRVRIG